ncbi:MAG: acetate kinase [Peptococcaceae bacterium]|nr:acetate kinase [Peptococcaceae bacterium]
MKILVVNCGSSTLKYKLFEMEGERVLAWGMADRIGSAGSRIYHRVPGREEIVLDDPLPGHGEAAERILGLLTDAGRGVLGAAAEISAVGHRVVHGGEFFQQPVLVDDGVILTLEECSDLAPLHNPPNLTGIRVCRRLMPHAAQVAVFDTAFHQTMPEYACLYPIPYRYYKDFRVRKYGFHGTSHKYVSARAAEIAGSGSGDLKIITCHLGNGSSLCAVRGGRSVDTTMGFTPLAGLMMGTRCGDIDPSIIPYLAEKEGLTAGRVVEVLNKDSGALGISGISSDFRDLFRAAGEGNKRARLAIDMFVYRVAAGIGSLVPAIGGLDMLVFTAGIGENSPEIRREVCAYLTWLGVLLDDDRNSVRGAEAEISAPGSAVKVLVIPTDEEKMIARETALLLK